MTGRWARTTLPGCAKRAVVVAAVLALAGCAPAPGISSNSGELVTVGDATADYLTEHGRRVQVERVIDGDTIAVTGDERVRLLTIDAPELNSRSAEPPECGAEVARDALADLLPEGAEVIVNGLKGEPDTDRYGRTLSNVYVEHGGVLVNVGLQLVADGWAVVYADYPTSDSPDAEALQVQAADAGLGIWGMCS